MQAARKYSSAESDTAYCDTCYHSVVRMYACVSSVTLVHPAKAVRLNMRHHLAGTLTNVVISNIVLDRGPGPPQEGET